jgi:hypothetical protein
MYYQNSVYNIVMIRARYGEVPAKSFGDQVKELPFREFKPGGSFYIKLRLIVTVK